MQEVSKRARIAQMYRMCMIWHKAIDAPEHIFNNKQAKPQKKQIFFSFLREWRIDILYYICIYIFTVNKKNMYVHVCIHAEI